MFLRDLVRQTWADAGVYDIPDARLQRFLQYVEAQRVECWPQIAATFRRQFPDYARVLVPPLVEVEDRALRIHLIASVDRNNKDDMALLREAVARADPEQHRFELDALAKRGLLGGGGGKPDPDKPGGRKPDGDKPGGGKPGGGKPDPDKPGGGKPGDVRPDPDMPGGGKPDPFKPDPFEPGGKPVVGRPGGRIPGAGGRPAAGDGTPKPAGPGKPTGKRG